MLLLAGLGLAIIGQAALAQEPGMKNPGSTTTEAPFQNTETPPGPTGDGDLFPSTGPAAGQPLPPGRRRPSRLLGNKNQRNARANDLISSEADADPLEVRVAYRRAKTQAMLQDPGLADLLNRAAAAPTDQIKREWLRQYYAELFTQVHKIDPSPALAAHVALLKVLARQRYDPQRRTLAGEENLLNGRGRGRR